MVYYHKLSVGRPYMVAVPDINSLSVGGDGYRPAFATSQRDAMFRRGGLSARPLHCDRRSHSCISERCIAL